MRKAVFVLLALLSMSNIFAQINLKVGANIGGQTSSLRGLEYETDNKFELVPTVGLNLEVSVSPSISIVTGFNFERWKKKREVFYYDNFGNPRGLNYAKEGYDFYNMPLLIRYKFGGKKKFFIDGGGFVNYFNKGQPNGFMPLFINLEGYNFGLALGGGTVFYLNDYLDITLQLRDDFGLSDVNKFKNQTSGNVKTNTIRFIASLNFKI
jgi:hypothetical protein